MPVIHELTLTCFSVRRYKLLTKEHNDVVRQETEPKTKTSEGIPISIIIYMYTMKIDVELPEKIKLLKSL